MSWTCAWCDHEERDGRETCSCCGSECGTCPSYAQDYIIREVREDSIRQDRPYQGPPLSTEIDDEDDE